MAGSMPSWGAETVGLDDATGRVLAEPIRADRDLPPFDRVMMDGIAIRMADWRRGVRRFAVAGVQPAGAPVGMLSQPGACLEVMTGASVPGGADAVVPVEQVAIEDGIAVVADDAAPVAGRHVHGRGTDVAAGATLVAAGSVVTAPVLGAAASVGMARMRVARAPSIGVLSTGDELLPVEVEPAPHQIRRSNVYGIGALCARHIAGARTDRYHERDDEPALERRIAEMLDRHDVLILSGGVSRGRFDFVPGVLARLGVEQRLHRVAQRPGKPLWFGVSRDGQPVFGLPGNPASGLVCCRRHVVRQVLGAMGADCSPEHAAVAEPVRRLAGMTRFAPVRWTVAQPGELSLQPVPLNTSGDFAGLAVSAGFCELPPGDGDVPAGEMLPFYRWEA